MGDRRRRDLLSQSVVTQPPPPLCLHRTVTHDSTAVRRIVVTVPVAVVVAPPVAVANCFLHESMLMEGQPVVESINETLHTLLEYLIWFFVSPVQTRLPFTVHLLRHYVPMETSVKQTLFRRHERIPLR